jgi:hypothetical protein
MFAFTLESLVLRGVVRSGELALRLGFGVKAEPDAPGNVNSVSLCLTGTRTPDTDPTPSGGYPKQGKCPRAGRSCRHAGSSIRESIATRATRGWQQFGGMAFAAAARIQALAGFVASAGEVNPRLAIFAVSSEGMQERSR